MVGQVDIAPAVEHVDVQGTSVSVHGVSAAALPARPLSRTAHADDGPEVQPAQQMAMGRSSGRIVAAGCGSSGRRGAEKIAGKRSLDAQPNLLAAILRLTLPRVSALS
jgi:hypothetical protein